MDINELDAALANPNVQKMLGGIQQAEGVKHGYNTGFGNTRFEDLTDHPRTSKEFTQTDGVKNKTTAAGAYQYLSRTWDDFRSNVKGIDDFGGKNQDRGAVWLMQRAGALDDVMAGNFEGAVGKLGGTWASLPSSTHPQGKRSWEFMSKALNTELVPRSPKGFAKLQQEADPSWPLLPTAKNQAAAAAVPNDPTPLLQTLEGQQQVLTGKVQGDKLATAQYDGLVAAQTARDTTTVGDLWSNYQTDPRVMSQIALMDHFTRDTEEVVPQGWSYMDQIDKIEGPWVGNQAAVDYLRENVNGPESLQRAQAQLMMRQDMDQVYGNRSALANFAVGGASSLMDIPGYVAGLGTAKAFQIAKMGHAVFAARGMRGATAAAFMGEAALGNVAVEALLDNLGEVKTAGDYAFAAGLGAAMAAPFMHGTLREASLTKGLDNMLNDMNAEHIQDQAAKLAKVQTENPGISPQEAVAKVEADEVAAIQRFDEQAQRGQFNEQVMPENVQQALKNTEQAVMDEIEAQAKVAQAEAQASRPDEQKQPVVQGEDAAATTPASTPEMEAPTAKQMIESIAEGTYKNVDAGDSARVSARYLLDVMPPGTLDVPLTLARRGSREHFNTANGGSIQINPDTRDWVALHEAVHAATSSKLDAARTGLKRSLEPGARAEVLPTASAPIKRLNDLMNTLRERMPDWAERASTDRVAYGLTNLDEFAAQALSDPQFQRWLNTQEVPGRTRGLSTAWKEFIRSLADALGIKAKPGYALNETLKVLDQILTAPEIKAEAAAVLNAPPANVLRNLERQWIQQIKANAEATMARTPIDQSRLNVLARRINGDIVSDGLRMAGHPSAVMQMLSRVVTETTTGAAGRGNTAAVVLPQLQGRMMGNFLPDYEGTFSQWARGQGHGVLAQGLRSDVTEQFDRLVFAEIHGRRQATGNVSTDAHVNAAADQVEAVMERARELQVREGVAGSEFLPASARGYIPQSLSGGVLSRMAAENPLALTAFKETLARQFQRRYGWDVDFVTDLVERYTERQMQRSKGYVDIDHMAAGGNESAVLRDVLDEMAGGNGQYADLAQLAQSRTLAQGNLKQRLDVFMSEPIGHGNLTVADFYSQDVKGLVRTYVHRTAGGAALTRHGIPGYRGVSMMRKVVAAEPTVVKEDLQLYDRVMGGILGTPYAGRVVSQHASNLGMLVNLQRMGSLVWNQIQEPLNMLHHLGLRSMVGGMSSLGRHIADVGRINAGQDSTSALRFVESYSGTQYGMDGYRMVAPLDPTDAQVNRYADNPSMLTRLLRGGGHLQTKVTGFRRLLAAQHRMVAEQIMLKGLKYIREPSAKHDVYLADMGFTPELVDFIRNELPGIARWDQHGNLADFDLTQLSDHTAADAFVNAIHRGTSQIIQDTFVGESNAWVHNDYLRVLTQFRSYGLTAMEKQWARSRMNSGYAGASMALMGQLLAGSMMHAARTHVQSLGREDREEYIERAMAWNQVVVSSMNYSSLSGSLSDVVQGTLFLAGGMNDDIKESMGSRNSSPGLGSLVPAAGSIEQGMRVLGGKADVYTALKQLPGANIWWLAPFINITKE